MFGVGGLLSLFRWMRYSTNQRNRSVCSVECKEVSVSVKESKPIESKPSHLSSSLKS